MNRRELIVLGSAALSIRPFMPSRAFAQSKYPEQPIRLVVPAPPGGVYDAVGRAWADKMKALLATIVVENQSGAGGSLGAAYVAQASPDGYTILLGGLITNVINTVAVSKRLYDPTKLEPISILGRNNYAFAVHPSFPAKTLKELIEFAKANPGKVSYGTAGVGSLNHLTGELFKFVAGTPDISHVPYRGAGPALVDLLSGQIPLAVVSFTGQVLEFHRAGKLRALAVTSPERLPTASDIPTTAEAGLPAVNTQQLLGLFAPPGTPKTIIDQIAQATGSAIADREFKNRLSASDFETFPDPSPEKMRIIIEETFATWTPIIKAIGLKLG